MNDAEAPAASRSPAPVGSASASTGLAVYYALLVTQTVSLIGSQVSQYAVGIAIYRATGHATPIALVAFFSTGKRKLGSGGQADTGAGLFIMPIQRPWLAKKISSEVGESLRWEPLPPVAAK